MADLTSNALLGLVQMSFARRGFSAAASAGASAGAGAGPGAAQASATDVAAVVPAASKTSLLQAGFDRFGADAILAVGLEVLEVPWDPVLAVMRAGRDVEDVIARWQRLERYYHSRHRTRVLTRGDQYLLLEHHAQRGRAPALVEDMLIAGLVAGLALDAGAVELDAGLEPGHTFMRKDVLQKLGAEPAAGARFWIRWRNFHPRYSKGEAGAAIEAGTPQAEIAGLVARDPAHSWRLEEIAGHMQQPTRSLQRRLARAGTSFSGLLRRTRANCAARMLADGSELAEIGYACGYSDQAHFTREFALCIGLTPGAYKRTLAAQGAPSAEASADVGATG